MSVLACDRVDCKNIMCNRCIVGGAYYICDDCWQELNVAKRGWPERMKASEVRDAIISFMNSSVGSHLEVDTEEEFERLTRE